MAALDIVTLDTATPQLEVPQAADTYNAPRAFAIAPVALTGSAATTSFDVTQTWNTTGTPTAIKLNVTDTASNAASLLMDLQRGGTSRFSVTKNGKALAEDQTSGPIYSFAQAPNTGIGRLANDLVLFSGATPTARLFSTDFSVDSANAIGFCSGAVNSTTADVLLTRDAADTLALRRTTNAQTFRLYETFTDASNYSRLDVYFDGGNLTFGLNAATAGTGVQRGLGFSTGGNLRWSIGATTGHFLAGADNAYDIGASGATRPRDVYLARNIHIAANAIMGTSGQYNFSGRGGIRNGGADGILLLQNEAFTDFGRLQFGGTTSSFPALKRSSAALIVRLADDSANAALESASVKTDAPTGGTSGTWKLGVAATVSPTSPNRTIEVDIGGTIYYLAAKTTND